MKVAIVTGGSKGIGKSIVNLFEKEGITVYNFSRSTGVDITEELIVKIAVENIIEKHGRIDILVNCAGVASTTDILDMELNEWENILNVNLTGTFIVTKHILKHMVSESYGKIVNITSIAGIDRSQVASVAYTASKHGVTGLTRQLSLYYANKGININAVAPSQTHTEMLDDNLTSKEIEEIEEKNPSKRLADPKDIANTVLFLCSDESSYINGETINVNGGQ